MADARVSVLLDIQSRLGGLDKALGGFKKLAGTVAGFACALIRTLQFQEERYYLTQ